MEWRMGVKREQPLLTLCATMTCLLCVQIVDGHDIHAKRLHLIENDKHVKVITIFC